MWHHKKPIRILSDLKNGTNVASQKTYPKFFGLKNCHTGLVVPSIALCNDGNLLFMTVTFF